MPLDTQTQLQRLAERVLACESALIEGAGGKVSPAFQACDKLRLPLCKVFGVGGFRPLLLRAIALAGSKCTWLRQLQVTADGVLDGLSDLEPKLDRETLAKGEILLMTELLGLLVTFIGPALTLRLVQDIWPPLEDWKLEKGTL